MNYKRHLSLAQLIRLLSEAAHPYGRTVQRDTISDIADLVDCQEMASKEGTWFERYWGIHHSGTVMCRTHDLGERESAIVDRYRIMWSEQSGWTIEEI